MHSLAGMRWVSYPGGAHSFTAFSRSHWPFWCGTVGSDPTLSLSLAWASRPLSLSLSISLARAGLAPPFSRGLCSHIRALHKLVSHHFLLAALSLVTPPACPKSLLCLSQSHWSFFLYIFVWWELNDSLSEQTMVNEQTPYFPVLARCQSDRWPLRLYYAHSKLRSISFLWKRLWQEQLFRVLLLFPPTHTTSQILSVILVSLCVCWSINQFQYIRGVLTLSRPSLGHTDPSDAAPWALIPLFLSLSRGPRAPSLFLSLSLLRVRALRPPSHVGSAPTSVLCTSWCRITFSWPLSRSWHPPHAPKASCVCLSLIGVSFSIYLCDGS